MFGTCAVAERLECVELAPAFNDPGRSTAGASSTHSKRSARFGCRFAALGNIRPGTLDDCVFPPRSRTSTCPARRSQRPHILSPWGDELHLSQRAARTV